ncbi:T9SS type B sorting domain-containing protein [Aureibacter tunicatorum]|uniref:Gliding motility-associated-like protein n=1 Tax=Aureibacter tunicatorum TaxID=866807 RepID=A0AAE3XN74_9BACT|nr:gliding motility-associated C-terminal domain-containing protein [Aureibacter tunicatorum]MDR6239048.1 gliding motility-associated-like protein [Aureibacter tunicatorum]BDD05026.1 hypothetical protein AUTU_25090 [Aureibacter tunicatorum]
MKLHKRFFKKLKILIWVLMLTCFSSHTSFAQLIDRDLELEVKDTLKVYTYQNQSLVVNDNSSVINLVNGTESDLDEAKVYIRYPDNSFNYQKNFDNLYLQDVDLNLAGQIVDTVSTNEITFRHLREEFYNVEYVRIDPNTQIKTIARSRFSFFYDRNNKKLEIRGDANKEAYKALFSRIIYKNTNPNIDLTQEADRTIEYILGGYFIFEDTSDDNPSNWKRHYYTVRGKDQMKTWSQARNLTEPNRPGTQDKGHRLNKMLSYFATFQSADEWRFIEREFQFDGLGGWVALQKVSGQWQWRSNDKTLVENGTLFTGLDGYNPWAIGEPNSTTNGYVAYVVPQGGDPSNGWGNNVPGIEGKWDDTFGSKNMPFIQEWHEDYAEEVLFKKNIIVRFAELNVDSEVSIGSCEEEVEISFELASVPDAELLVEWSASNANGEVVVNSEAKNGDTHSVKVKFTGDSHIFHYTVKTNQFTQDPVTDETLLTEVELETSSITVTRLAEPSITFSEDEFTRRTNSTSPITFDVNVTDASGMKTASDIVWDLTPNAGVETDFDTNSPKISPNYGAVDTYIYVGSLDDAYGCNTMDTVTVKIIEPLDITPNDKTIGYCEADGSTLHEISLKVEGEELDLTYVWSEATNGAFEPGADLEQAQVNVTVNEGATSATFKCTITDNLTGDEWVKVVEITVLPSVSVEAIDLNEFVVTKGGAVETFRLKELNDAVDESTITWSESPTQEASVDNMSSVPQLETLDVGVYTYIVEAKDTLGCGVSPATFEVELIDIPSLEIGRCQGIDDSFEVKVVDFYASTANVVYELVDSDVLESEEAPVRNQDGTVTFKLKWKESALDDNNVDLDIAEFNYKVNLDNVNGFEIGDQIVFSQQITFADLPIVNIVSGDPIVVDANQNNIDQTFEINVADLANTTIEWSDITDPQREVLSNNEQVLTPNPAASKEYKVKVSDNTYNCFVEFTFDFTRGSLKAIADTIYMYQDDVLRQIDILGNDEGVVSTTTVAIDPDAEWVYGEGELTSTGVINFTANQTPVLTTIVKQTFDYTLTDIHSNTSTATVTVFILPSSREIVIPVCETDTLVAVSDDEAYQVDWAIISGSEATIITPSGVVSDVSRILSVGVYEYTLKDAGGNPQKSGLIEVKRGTGPSVGIYAYDQQDDLYLFSDTLRIGKYEVLDEKLVLLGTEEEYFGWNINDSTDLKTIADRVDFTWQPVEIIVEKDSLFEYSFMAEDNDGCRAYDTLQIVRFNTAPEMEDVDISIRDGIPARINIDLSDEDTLDDIDTYTVVQEDGTLIHGQAEFYDGEFTYIPFTSSKFTDKVKIRACDFSGECVESYVYIESQSTGLTEVLTPNGDGKNDRFEVTIVEPSQRVHLIVMNRWGNKVYESEDYQDDWSGYSNSGSAFGNELLSQGTYFYIIKVEDMEDITGYVQIAY